MVAGSMGWARPPWPGCWCGRSCAAIPDRCSACRSPASTGTILYLAMDRPPQIARSMHRQFSEPARDLGEQLKVWKGPPPGDIANNPGCWPSWPTHYSADTVFLDSVKDAAIGLSEDESVPATTAPGRYCSPRKAAVRAAPHRQARPAGHPPRADIYGSAWLTNGTGSIILLTGKPGDPIVGFRHLVRPPRSRPVVLLHDEAPGRWASTTPPIWSSWWRPSHRRGWPPGRLRWRSSSKTTAPGEIEKARRAGQAGSGRVGCGASRVSKAAGRRHADCVVPAMRTDHAPITFSQNAGQAITRPFDHEGDHGGVTAITIFTKPQVKRSRTDHGNDHAPSFTDPTASIDAGVVSGWPPTNTTSTNVRRQPVPPTPTRPIGAGGTEENEGSSR